MRLARGAVFESEGLKHDLARKSVRGGIVTVGMQAARTGVQIAGVVALARILSPHDYGLVAMATVVIGLAQMFSDAGLATATVQRESISHDQISTLFWLNILVSIALCLITLTAAPLVVAFYGPKELGPVTAALSTTFLIGGVAIQHEALLRRHMLFFSVGLAQLLQQLATVVVSIIAALYGLGYWSLIIGTLAGTVVFSAAIIWFCPWMPGKPKRGTDSRSMVKFGGDVTLFSIANYFSRNSDNMLIGRVLGATALGLYSKAYQLFLLPFVQVRVPLTGVALPAMSALKDDNARYVSYYKRVLEVLALVAVPMAAYSAIEGQFVIDIALGAKWSAAGPVFRILAIAGLVQAVASTRGMVLISSGRSRKYAKLGIADATVTVSAFLIGIRWGIVGVASAYAVVNLVFLFPSLWYTFDGTSIRIVDFVSAMSRPVGYSVLSGLAIVAVLAAWPAGGVAVHIAALCAFALVYVGLAVLSTQVRDTVGLILRNAK